MDLITLAGLEFLSSLRACALARLRAIHRFKCALLAFLRLPQIETNQKVNMILKGLSQWWSGNIKRAIRLYSVNLWESRLNAIVGRDDKVNPKAKLEAVNSAHAGIGNPLLSQKPLSANAKQLYLCWIYIVLRLNKYPIKGTLLEI
ncbi:hypothetical protein HDU92_000962 [Lobulomyces angularis]|nr:hypothetical protein HDU92_000962 [Lobulomyces angularis]